MANTGPAGSDTDDLAATVAGLRQQLADLERRLGERYRGPQIPDGPTPVRQSSQVVDSGHEGYRQRVLVGTASTGLVRMEWVDRRYHQLVPPNWSMVELVQYVNGFVPMRYQIGDAQNLIVRAFMTAGDFEWLFLLEHDTMLPHNGLMLLDDWMEKATVPVVSGLYYTRSRPSEPLIYRGRGNRFYGDWKHGDMVWCDGVPTGCLLIHRSIIAAMWEEAEPYIIQNPDGRREEVRRVFDFPRKAWFDPESQQYQAMTGTSDLQWCTDVMEGGIFAKAGWPQYEGMQWPFLVDTRLFCKHIDVDGTQYP